VALFANFHVLLVGPAPRGAIALLPLGAAACFLLLATLVCILMALLARLHMLLVTTTLIGILLLLYGSRSDDRFNYRKRWP
jgi:hypothetical protein